MKRKDILKDYRLQDNEGQGKARWEYCGTYYEFSIPEKALTRFKLFVLLLSAFQFAAVVMMGMTNNPGSRQFFIVIPYTGILFVSVAGIWNAVCLLAAKEKLNQKTFERNYLWLLRGTVLQIILGGILVTGEVVFAFRGADMSKEVIIIAGIALVMAVAVIQRASLSRHPCKPIIKSPVLMQ